MSTSLDRTIQYLRGAVEEARVAYQNAYSDAEIDAASHKMIADLTAMLEAQVQLVEGLERALRKAEAKR